MNRYIFNFINNLKLRGKMLILVLPLVILPIIIIGGVIGVISTQQAYRGITQTSEDDLDHMARFTLDLLDSHHQQFQVYKADKRETIREELKTLTDLAYSLVEAQSQQHKQGKTTLQQAKEQARKALRKVNIGETGYSYAMTSTGDLTVHIAREGENIYNEQDEDGRYFIRAMCKAAVKSPPGRVLYTIYPWRNAALGDKHPRKKIVAYRYFPEWDWIIATGGYLEETYDDIAFEQRSFNDLKLKIKSKHVGRTGYIYCMDRSGTLMIHPDAEGENIYDAEDSEGRKFIQEMTVRKNGWIRYPWKNVGEKTPRMKIVRYRHFQPWDWIIAVGSYEEEFFHEANVIKWRIVATMLLLPLFVGTAAVLMVVVASRVLTQPIHEMIEVIRQVRRGRLERRMKVESSDELGELAATFNNMADIIKRNQEMEASLAQQGKMASLGVLASGVAHEINNPLGVILGYASYMEGKMSQDEPYYRFIHEIKRESKRCKKIVQDLLSYARTPKPTLVLTDIHELLDQIVDFAANHTDMHHVRVNKDFACDTPLVMADGDQLRQVAINLILNAGAAMPEGGELVVSTALDGQGHILIGFKDNGEGIPAENMEKIFEPFFTTKARGTGLGLAITRQIIEQHHGKITLESSVGVGTTFTIHLPINREEETYGAEAHPAY